jgi:predicted transposase YdaD
MDPKKTPPETPWARELRLELEAAGEARGKLEGRAEGELKGKAEGKQEALLLLLSTRELAVTAMQRRRIQECTDLALLDRWIRLAASRRPTRCSASPARAGHCASR